MDIKINLTEEEKRDLEDLKDLGSEQIVPFLEEAFEDYLELTNDAGQKLANNYYVHRAIIRLLRALDR